MDDHLWCAEFQGTDANDIPEVALDVWVEIPSRLLQRDIAYLDLHSGCLSEERIMRVPPSIRVFGSRNSDSVREGYAGLPLAALSTLTRVEQISRADETGGCVHAEGGVYGTDVAVDGDGFWTSDLRCSIHEGPETCIR
ncbi:hypothetical protein ARMGADRAFT_362680 [Armillaria gallica]|uniref:Uncharacterized protein n=1 Tax=Armillaria gallica TaxID=47427 RepID=A0A2H3DCJ4_ARMGA|nr:hypothetical protein ARMGADRAFT_362680 [Armillaria gallica]